MTGRKERKNSSTCMWDSNPQPLAYMDRGTTTCAIALRGSLKPQKWFLSCGRALLAFLSGRGQISTDGRVRKYSNAWEGLEPTTLYTLDRALYH